MPAEADAAREPLASDEPSQPGDDEKKKRKKKEKLRSAWIAFVGRILAQVIGAAATVSLGIFIAGRMSDVAAPEPPTPASARRSRVASLTSGATVSIAVLPLENFSGDAKQDYFADGMTEQLITDLAQMEGLRVISRTSSMSYKDQRKPLPEIAQELGVDLVVEGSVSRSGDRIRVSAQLIDARSDEHLWAGSYDRTARDVLALQSEVARAIASEVKGALTPSQQARMSQARPVDPEVFDLYLRGRQAWNRRTQDGFREAIGYYEQALRKDPGFALAHAGMSDALGLSASAAENRAEVAARAKAAASRALEIDPMLAEAHTSLAALYHREEGNWRDAEREFLKALALNPGYATAHQWYAILLAEEGRDVEALGHAEQAVLLDPLSGAIHQTLGLVHYYGRRYAQAVAAARKALGLVPQLPLASHLLARALLASGQAQAAIQALETSAAPRSADILALSSLAYLRLGDRARADALFGELRAVDPLPTAALARWYAGAGDAGAALDMLERTMASRARSFQGLMADPVFDGLRGDERFARLVRGVTPS